MALFFLHNIVVDRIFLFWEMDCHCHWYPPEFSLEEIYSLPDHVQGIIVVPETLKTSELVLTMRHPRVWPCAGLHPLHPDDQGGIRSVTINDWTPMESFIRSHHTHLVALGECGLDYSRHHFDSLETLESAKASQMHVFKSHIQLSKELDLPLNVHSRNAGHYAVDALIESQAKGLLHAFDGNIKHALKAASHGLYFSIPPSIVRNPGFQKLAREIPLDFLVLESDAPALPPVKGERNHPRNISISCQSIASAKNLNLATVYQITTENAQKLFPKLVYSNTRA